MKLILKLIKMIPQDLRQHVPRTIKDCILNFVENKDETLAADRLRENLAELSGRNTSFRAAHGKKVVYILHNSLPYSSGGYAIRTQGLAKGLKQNAWDVNCITRPGFPHDLADFKWNQLPQLADCIDGVFYRRILEPHWNNVGSNYAYIEQAALALEKEFKELNADAVIAASNFIVGLMSLLAAKKLRLPFIYEVRGLWEVTRMSREPRYANSKHYHTMETWETLVAQHADMVFTLTGPMRDELVRRGVDREKISLLPNACDTERFRPIEYNAKLAAELGLPPGIPVIGYIGTFVQYEGLDLLVEACAQLKRQGAVFRLLLVGNENTSGAGVGGITKRIMRIARHQGLGDWLILTGRVPHNMVEQYYSIIDICPFPRLPLPVTEMVSPMKPLEAMAMAKAVVASNVGGMKEMLLPEVNGLVFDKGSKDSLASVLLQLLNNEELRTQLSEQARVWVQQNRNWHAIAESLSLCLDHFVCDAKN